MFHTAKASSTHGNNHTTKNGSKN